MWGRSSEVGDRYNEKVTQNHEVSAEDYEIQKQQFYKEKHRRIHYMKPHPGRRSPYKLRIWAHRDNLRWCQDNHDYILVDWIRQASNVSAEFRAELGNLIWANVEMSTDWQSGDIWHLPRLVEERPTASLGIKSINMSLDLECSTHLNWDSAEFYDWCSEISQTLEVETLKFFITIKEDVLPSLGNFHGSFFGLTAARSLRVTMRSKSASASFFQTISKIPKIRTLNKSDI